MTLDCAMTPTPTRAIYVYAVAELLIVGVAKVRR